MPAQRVGGDEAMVSALLGQDPDQGCEDGPVWPRGTGPGDLSAQHRNLVSQHQDLGVLGGLPASEQLEPAEELAQDQVEESERHGRTSSLLSGSDAKPHVKLGTTFPAPTGLRCSARP
jgi:hypothetical protein